MSVERQQPIGVVLAGGAARRLGGAKSTARLGGRPLLGYAVEALQAAVGEVAVVAKPATGLPALPDGVTVWHEPPAPQHPLVGVVWALRCAAGRAVLVCAGDLPFVTPVLLARLAAGDAGGAPATVAAAPGPRGPLQPLLARYEPAAVRLLAPAAIAGTAPLRSVVAALHPAVVAVDDARVLFNVNTPEDLAAAEALLAAP